MKKIKVAKSWQLGFFFSATSTAQNSPEFYSFLYPMICGTIISGLQMNKALLTNILKAYYISKICLEINDLTPCIERVFLHFRYLCLDEADRMIDMGFEEDVRTIFSYFKGGLISEEIFSLNPSSKRCEKSLSSKAMK